MNNYPDNVDPNDPYAPWNDNRKFIDCDECGGSGKIYPYEDEIVYRKCKDCKGTGEIQIEKD